MEDGGNGIVHGAVRMIHKLHEEPLEALHDDGSEYNVTIVKKALHCILLLGTGTMIVVWKHDRTAQGNELKISMKTSTSWSAYYLIRNVVWSSSFSCVNSVYSFPHISPMCS